MIKKRWAWVGLAFLLSVCVFADEREDDQREYDRAVRETNTALSNDSMRASCPGLDLVVTCGDGVCDPKAGENETTCPADCVPALIKSYNRQTLCRGITQILAPKSIEEVQATVRTAAFVKTKLRVVGALHSANEQLCTTGAILSTENLNHVIGIEKFNGKETVVAEAGVKLFDLSEWLHARNRALGFINIGYRNVTIAGAAATGSHGSSAMHRAVVSNAVEGVTVVMADGEVKEFSAATTNPMTWKAVRANLGMMGVVIRVRFSIEPQFNLHVKVDFENDKKLFEDGGVWKRIEGCDFALINWFPGSGRYMRSCGKKTTAKAEPGADNTLLDPGFPDFIVNPFKKVLQFGACHNTVACLVERVRYWLFKLAPPYLVQDEFGDLVPTDSVVGPSHRMISSVLTPYQKGFFQMDWEVAVPYSRAQEALAAVHELANKAHICLPLVGVFLRFAPSEDATLIAHTVSLGEFKPGEPVMFIEMPVYLPTAFPPAMKAAYDRPYEDFARLLIERFHGRPHWAKNRDWVFQLANDHDAYGPNLEAFKREVLRADPGGLFMNDWGKLIGVSSSK